MTIAAIRSCLSYLCIPCISPDKVVTPMQLWQELEEANDRRIELWPGQKLVLAEVDVNRYLSEFEKNPEGTIEIFDSKVAIKFKILIIGDDFKLQALTLFSGKKGLMIESSTPLEVHLVR